MAKIIDESVSDALERSIRNAKHLRAEHSAPVAAARMAARRLDLLDQNGWEIDGKLDNVTLPTFLKYCQALGLIPELAEPAVARKPSAGKPPDQLAAFRARSKVG